jgi:hypothetical protein
VSNDGRFDFRCEEINVKKGFCNEERE